MDGIWRASKRHIQINEGGMRGCVFVVYWKGTFAPFLDFAIRLPFRWFGFGWSGGKPYARTHRTGTWKFI